MFEDEAGMAGYELTICVETRSRSCSTRRLFGSKLYMLLEFRLAANGQDARGGFLAHMRVPAPEASHGHKAF